MATVATLLTSARYDLKDFSGQMWDDTQLVDYLNRVVIVMDNVLSSLRSDRCIDYNATATLSATDNSVAVPSNTNQVLDVWIGSDLKYKTTPQDIYARRIYNGGATGEPQHWAPTDETMIFDYTADDDYTIKIIRTVKTATLTTSSNMPYDDKFNEYFREAVINMAHKAKDNAVVNVDSMYFEEFKRIAMMDVVTRGYVPTYYYKDF